MKSYLFFTLALGLFCSCRTNSLPVSGKEPEKENPTGSELMVNGVEITGSAGSYTFTVTLSSPDTGCDQYADWWEVFHADGTLAYRRILAHSHVNEQPFARSGAGIDIQADDSIYVRGHMNNLGYGSQVYKGTIDGGLKAARIAKDFFAKLADQTPLPSKCDF